MPDVKTPHFFDCVVLSNFALAGRCDLIASRYGYNTIITSEVLDEIIEGISQGYSQLKSIMTLVISKNLQQTNLVLDERDRYAQLLINLGPGESSCIVCAQFRGGVVVTDDQVARKICAEQSIPVTGTIGILKALCVDGVLHSDEADAVLQDMISQGFYSPVRSISSLL